MAILCRSTYAQYVLAGGSAKLANTVNAKSSSYSVGVGAGFFLSPSFSLDLSATLSSSSMDYNENVNVIGKSVALSGVYHRHITGNLFYIPQIEAGYMNFSVEHDKFDFVSLALAPLAFEYRAEGSSWGFQASLGAAGIVFPVAGAVKDYKSIYLIDLNTVNLGVVYYF